MDGQVVIGTTLDTKSFDAQIKQTEARLNQLERAYEKALNPSSKGLSENVVPDEKALQKLQVEIEKTGNQLNSLYQKQAQINKADISGITSSIQKAGSGLEGIIKKTIRWGLAIFGVRSAYMFIRQEMGVLSQYNEDIGADVEYMRWTLANALKPVIETIIQLAYKLLVFIGYILNKLFGINIFAEASAENFEKQKKALSGANKNAKELQKTLAGFDEMNIIQENGTTKTGGGGGVPTMDFGDVDFGEIDKKIDSFIQRISQKWKKLGEDMSYYISRPELFDQAFGVWGTFVYGVTKIFYGIYEVIDGLVDEVAGIFKIIKGIVTGDTNLIKEGIKQFVEGAGKILRGIIDIVTGIKDTIFGIVKGIFLTIINWAGDFIKNIGPTLKNGFKDIWNAIKNSATATVDGIKSVFSAIGTWFKKNVADKIVSAFNTAWDAAKAGARGVKDTIVGIFDALLDALVAPINLMIDGVNLLIDGLNKVKPGKDISHVPKLRQKSEKASGGGGFRAKGGIFYPSKLPKLAVGGIINQPGSGVPYNGAYIGERGAEAVVPLTDSQQMELLGETIGRYITVELTNVTQLDGRTIARKVDKIQQNNNFVMNR